MGTDTAFFVVSDPPDEMLCLFKEAILNSAFTEAFTETVRLVSFL